MISTQMYPTSAGPGPRFRVGDWVRVVYNDNGTGEYVGMVAQILDVKPYEKYCYTLSCCSTGFGDHEVALEHLDFGPSYMGMDTAYGPSTMSHTVNGSNHLSSKALTDAIEAVANKRREIKDQKHRASRKIYWNRVRRNILK